MRPSCSGTTACPRSLRSRGTPPSPPSEPNPQRSECNLWMLCVTAATGCPMKSNLWSRAPAAWPPLSSSRSVQSKLSPSTYTLCPLLLLLIHSSTWHVPLFFWYACGAEKAICWPLLAAHRLISRQESRLRQTTLMSVGVFSVWARPGAACLAMARVSLTFTPRSITSSPNSQR